MFDIKKIRSISIDNKPALEAVTAIKAVADIEAIIQSQDPWHYETLINSLEQKSTSMLVVYEGGQNCRFDSKPIGYCLYQVVFEQAEILRIGTHPDFQRQGIASQLFEALDQQLQKLKVEDLILEVRADNAPAIALYECQGFVTIHQRKGYYQQPNQPAIDALIMQRHY